MRTIVLTVTLVALAQLAAGCATGGKSEVERGSLAADDALTGYRTHGTPTQPDSRWNKANIRQTLATYNESREEKEQVKCSYENEIGSRMHRLYCRMEKSGRPLNKEAILSLGRIGLPVNSVVR